MYREIFLVVALTRCGDTKPGQYCADDPKLPPLKNEKVPSVGMNAIQLIKSKGYPVEQHQNVQTKDGYLLELHRIPHGTHNSNSTAKPVVLIMHGLFSSSEVFICTDPSKGLGFIMADLGYDVWLGNGRGNTWSRKHIKYDPDNDSEFWNFSWHEVGYYDLPTTIDYILSKTRKKSLYFIGHSQGTTAFFVMVSMRPKYNRKVRYMAALAPIVYMSHIPNPFFQIIGRYLHASTWLSENAGADEFLPNCKLYNLIGQAICNEEAKSKVICHNIMFLMMGYDSDQFNETILPVIMTNIPAGAATKQVLHYAQGIHSGRFCQYDYGPSRNLIFYGQNPPPKYPLNRITTPVGIYYGKNDWVAAVQDVEQLCLELGNLVSKYLVPYEKFNHGDFLYANDVVPMVYKYVISDMQKY